MSLICLTTFVIQLLSDNVLHWVFFPFPERHPEELTRPFGSPVPEIIAAPLQPRLVNALSAEHCGSPKKSMVPLAFKVHRAAFTVGVLLLSA